MESNVCPYFGLIGDMCMAARKSNKFYSCTHTNSYETCIVYKAKKRKDEESMENKTLEKTLDTLGSVTKLAANLSEAKKDPKPVPLNKTDDNSNNASTGTQSVNVLVGSDKKREPRPVEKHIHTYPENRPLTTEECELDLKKAQMEFDLKKSQQVFDQRLEDRNWQYKMEQEKKNERKSKVRRIIGGILVAIGVGSVGYSIYTDYRDHKNSAMVPKALPENSTVKPDGGEVK